MPPIPSNAVDAAGRAACAPADHLTTRIARLVGAEADAGAVYGAPVEREGVTVIPVAKVRWGFGGGSGRGVRPADPDTNAESSGEGGGGGARVTPVGYIELREDTATFRHIRTEALPVPPAAILAGGLVATLILRALVRARRR